MEGFVTAQHTKGRCVPLLFVSALLVQHSNAVSEQPNDVNEQHDMAQNVTGSFLENITLKKIKMNLTFDYEQHRQVPKRTERRGGPCLPFKEILTEVTEGRIEWEEDLVMCPQSAIWVLQPPPDHGLVLEFSNVFTTDTSLLTVTWNCSQCHHRDFNESTDPESQHMCQRIFNHTNYQDYDMSPFLVRGEAVITITTEKKKEVDFQSSTVNITYNAHPLRDMPQKIEEIALTNFYTKMMFEKGITTSKTLYNCSTVVPPSRMPAALWCDSVRHCLDGEDEWSVREDGNYSCAQQPGVCASGSLERSVNAVPYHEYCIGMALSNSASDIARNDFHYFVEGVDSTGVLTDETSLSLMRNIALKSGATSSYIPLVNSRSTPTGERLLHLYRFVWRWDGTYRHPAAYRYPQVPKRSLDKGCAVLTWVPVLKFTPTSCSDIVLVDSFIFAFTTLDFYIYSIGAGVQSSAKLHLPRPKSRINVTKFATRNCSDGSLVRIFHPCPTAEKFARFGERKKATEVLSSSAFPLFKCLYGPSVHYTVVCDGVQDCVDGSDEHDCEDDWLLSSAVYFRCKTIIQYVSIDIRCDGLPDCLDGSDEENCAICDNEKILCSALGCLPSHYHMYFNECTLDQHISIESNDNETHFCSSEVRGTAVVRLDGFGMSCLSPFTSETNVEGLFYCNVGDYYIPSYMINNGVWDCYYGEDEKIPAEKITCPGYYRCHETGNCLHPEFVCDGIVHCPNRDDELYCCSKSSVDCNCPKSQYYPCYSRPVSCSCEGLACICKVTSDASVDDVDVVGFGLRFLHIIGSFPGGFLEVVQSDTKSLDLLQFLNVSSCNISKVNLGRLHLLKILDLSFNHLNSMSYPALRLSLSRLTDLYLSGNPLVTQLQSLDSTLHRLPELQHLTIQDGGLQRVGNATFRHFKQLSYLDIRNNKLQDYKVDIFQDLTKLEVLYTDDYKLCCPAFHRNREIECHAPKDELSSCSDLLRSDALRIFLWIVSLLALLGNGGVLVYRGYTYKHTAALPFRLLVTNLCAADLLMGLYMLVIGVVDVIFRGSYVGQEKEWRASNACTAAGFLALLSSEVSALVVCLITLDRALSICFPFKVTVHLSRRLTCLLCFGAWILGLVLAATPLLAQLQFYGETAICLPLPITRRQFTGQAYSFAVFIVFNFVLFLFIGAGQIAIFRAIRHTGRVSGKGSQRRQQDLAIARRLFLVVLTDFLCWFPIGLMGLLTYVGDVPISGEVNVVAAIFVLPVNSALNPFLYTLNSLLETWAKKRVLKKARQLLANLHTETSAMSQATVEEIALACLKDCKKDALEKIAVTCFQESKEFDILTLEKIAEACLKECRGFHRQARREMVLTLFRTCNPIDKERIMRTLNLYKFNDDVTSDDDVACDFISENRQGVKMEDTEVTEC